MNKTKRLNRGTVKKAAEMILSAVVLFGAVFIFSSKYDLDQAAESVENNMQYVRAQCVRYEGFYADDLTQSLFRLVDKAQDISRDILYEGNGSGAESLKQLAADHNVSGIIVTDSSGGLLSEYNSDDTGFRYWERYILDRNVLNISEYPVKVYSDRTYFGNDCYDYAAVSRSDGEGIVFCYIHQPRRSLENSRMFMTTLLSGYSMRMNGTIFITDGEKVITSNDDSLIGLSTKDSPIVKSFSDNGGSGLIQIFDEGASYYGMQEKCLTYYIYAYYPAGNVFLMRWSLMAYTAVAYVIFWGLIFMLTKRAQQKRLKDHQRIELQYRKNLLKSAREAEKANAAKSDFLRRMSHDIRTPINGIRGMVEIADHFPDDVDKQTECRQKIWEASGYLLDLVNDILDMNKLESGTIVLESVSFDLGEMFDEIKVIADQNALERGVAFSMELPAELQTWLIGSPTHVKRVLMNLVSNAIKYNKPGGTVDLRCREISRRDDRIELEFICEDTGLGMSEEFQKKMFEPFQQENISARSSYEGTGLGLSIVKNLVIMMGGDISCTSEKGKGSRFVVKLPFRVDRNAKKSGTEPDEISLNGIRVLLAEDNELNMEITQFTLESEGAVVIPACNGREAVDIFTASEPGSIDVILMDIMMPVMDGNEAARMIRASGRSDSGTVPIIALTANAFTDDRLEAERAGMNAHLAKPLESSKIKQVISKYVRRTL